MKTIFIILFLSISCFSYSQVTLSSEDGQQLRLQSMEVIKNLDKDWSKARDIILPTDYDSYCSYYLTSCPIEIVDFNNYLQQIKNAKITPIAKTRLIIDRNDYLLFSMEISSKLGPTQIIPLLVLENGGNFKLIPQENEQKLFTIKALITYLDHSRFLEDVKEEFDTTKPIQEVALYERLISEASDLEISDESLFRIPPLREDKALPLKYQGRISKEYLREEYERAEILFQRGFEVEAANILSSKISTEDLQKIIKDEAKN